MRACKVPCPAVVSSNAYLHKEDKLLYPDHHLIWSAESGFRPMQEVVWHKVIQELWCGQISIVVTYKDRERHGIMYCKGFWGNKPQVYIPPLNNHAWARELTWLLKGNPIPLPPFNPSRLLSIICICVDNISMALTMCVCVNNVQEPSNR